MLDVCLMGTGGSMPKPKRHLASALLRYGGASIVIDCGEGTQIAMKKAEFAFSRVGLILITHFHADHISGLPGMLLSMGNEGRIEPIVIAGPTGLTHVVSSICVIARGLPFEVRMYEFPPEGGELPCEVFAESYDPAAMTWDCLDKDACHVNGHGNPMDSFRIKSFSLNHSVPCLGYRISLPRAGKFDPDRARAAGIPIKLWGRLQRGEEVNGFSPGDVLGAPRPGIDVSYVTDTRPSEIIASEVLRSDLLICEGMFSSDKQERALKSRHMTAGEAAYIARDAEVGELWLTHYSPSVNDTGICLEEARAIFPNTIAGFDGMKKTINFRDE